MPIRRPDVPARIMLQHAGRRLGRIEADGLDIVFNIDIFVGPDTPAKRPIDGKVIPDIDIVVDHDGDLAETRAQRPRAVHELAYLPNELFLQRDN